MPRSVAHFLLVTLAVLGLLGPRGGIEAHAHDGGDQAHDHGAAHRVWVSHVHADGSRHEHPASVPSGAPSPEDGGDPDEHGHARTAPDATLHRGTPCLPDAGVHGGAALPASMDASPEPGADAPTRPPPCTGGEGSARSAAARLVRGIGLRL